MRRQNKILSTQCIKLSSSKSEPNILKSVYNDIPKINGTINDFVWQNLDRWPDKTAVVCAATGHGYTYEQTHRMSISIAASLRAKLRLQNGDVVAVALPNMPEYPCTVLGILEAGCVASLLNPAYTPHELKRLLELVDCKAVVTTAPVYPKVVEALKGSKRRPILVVGHGELPEGALSFTEFAADRAVDTDCLRSARRAPGDLALLPFSSGTSGLPKAVRLTHGSVVAMNQMIYDPDVLAIDEATASFQSAVPAVLPFFHIFGLNAVMMNLLGRGCKLITFPAFEPQLFLETIVKQRVEHLYIVPPMVALLGAHPAASAEALASVRGVVSGAAPLAPEDVQPLLAKNRRLVFRQGYGLTETNGGVSVGGKADRNHAAVGHVFGSCELKVAHPDSLQALGPGQEGEIWVRGPNLMSGYLGSEEEGLVDGWFRTGDLGRYDQRGYLYITDRLKDLIKVKGFQVAPAELEAVLRTHPAVLECGVVGVGVGAGGGRGGEEPLAFVVLRGGEHPSAGALAAYVNARVAPFKRVREVRVVRELPRGPAGKVLRRALRDRYC
ncbi:unnamed protein product, partial [Iphiclides podalirius]